MRKTDAAEEANLSDFQKELVQLAATLNGDHTKDIYPNKLVENMTVAQGAQYTKDSLKVFWNDNENVKDTTNAKKKKSFANKLLICFVCGQS